MAYGDALKAVKEIIQEALTQAAEVGRLEDVSVHDMDGGDATYYLVNVSTGNTVTVEVDHL